MVEPVSVEQLKALRTVAKRQLTKVVNRVGRTYTEMTMEELEESYFKLTDEGEKLMGINDDIEAELLAEVGAGSQLNPEQKSDLARTEKDCQTKLKEIKSLLQGRLWEDFGEAEVTLGLEAAERVNQKLTSIRPDTRKEAYDFMVDHLGELLETAKATFQKWNRWTPRPEGRDITQRLRVLGQSLLEFVSSKADYIQAKGEEEDKTAILGQAAPYTPAIRLKPTSLPKFTGNKRDFYRWWKEWDALQSQAEPSGSKELKKCQLLDSLEVKIVKDLRLSSYDSADDIVRVLTNRFGNCTAIAIEIIEELQRVPPIRSQQPRKIIDLIQVVEKALSDLQDLGDTGAITNPLTTKSIESKLPDGLKKEWLLYAAERGGGRRQENRFDNLLCFLKSQESIYEEMDQLKDEESSRKETRLEPRQARTRATGSSSSDTLSTCRLCGDPRHPKKLYHCTKFRYMKPIEREEAVKKVGACRKCLEVHERSYTCKPSFLCRRPECENVSNHHYYLCRKATKSPGMSSSSSPKGRRCTEAQEVFLAKLSPDLALQCKNAFCNTVSRTLNSKIQSDLLEEQGVQEIPVIMMILEVMANAGQTIGTLIDLASDTNYITHAEAERLNLRCEDITLTVHGVGDMKISVKTKRYLLKIRVQSSQGTIIPHQLLCYGLDSIAEIQRHVSARQLARFFPDVHPDELKRPRKIDLLISHKEGRLVPQKIRTVGDLVLWDGPLGKTVGGAHPGLFEQSIIQAHTSKTHFARSMRSAAVRYEELLDSSCQPEKSCFTSSRDFLKWWKWESIGAACVPKCGGCRCGNCQPGGKDMTLAEERELEVVRSGLSYIASDEHSSDPHWHSSYPWLADPAMLPNNRKGVEATFLRTEKQLSREPEWKAAYTGQVHEMVARQAAVKLTKQELQTWSGPVWYISHLIAPNPHSVTTPVRLVWNSSQRYKGLSLNDLLMKGPDVLNPIRAVLLRFRSGRFAALGDIKKMYNSVWLDEREKHLHRFLWRDKEEDDIDVYAITRVNIGDRPAGCIAQVAMRETASLPMFWHLKEERRVLQEDTYVDDILTSHNVLAELRGITTNVREVLKAGGFYLKPWVISGQLEENKTQDRLISKTILLPNQMGEDENKALGLGYNLRDDTIHIMVAINFSKKKRKMRVGQHLREDQVKDCTPDPLTRRELLSQTAGLYDPIGLTAPVKQRGTILIRQAFQEAKTALSDVQETWDVALSEALRQRAIGVFEDYARLANIKFTRALTPPDTQGDPYGVTFSDGSEQAFGAVLYLRWSCTQGPVVRLVEAKAKLTPIDHQGDAVKAEACGAVFAARLKKYFEQHCRIQVKRWFHFIDSQTILGAIQRESYGYKTFFANRVGELQESTRVEDWWWIPGASNIADIITRGSSPEDLLADSEWQKGPRFLHQPMERWPMKSAKDIAAAASESVAKLQKKAFITAVMTRSQGKKAKEAESTKQEVQREASILGRLPSDAGKIVKVERFSDLNQLIRTTALVWRAAKKFIKLKKDPDSLKWEAVNLSGPISAQECKDAMRDLCISAQGAGSSQNSFPSSTMDRLVVFKDQQTGLLLCGGRIQSFEDDNVAIPLLPYDSWLSTLIARDAHKRAHEGVAATLLRMRRRAWIIRGRRMAQKTVDSCIICKKRKAMRCQQVMGDLPLERTTPTSPFCYTTTDLFGPYKVRDDVKKRVSMKAWGVVFCCMVSRAIHAELVNSMSTESFLFAYQRFTAIRGHPTKIWSDPGTNFVGAKTFLEDMYTYLDKLDKPAIEKSAAVNGTAFHWKLNPADAPHRNGAAEAAVKILKRALQSLGAESTLSFSEFYTKLQLAANLANERPIDAKVQSREDQILYITPNSLLLGRASQGSCTRAVDFAKYPYKRLREMDSQVGKFWRAWSQLAGPNLFTRSKWHTTQRNLAIGDIVWVCDQNALRGQFRLGRVTDVSPDSKGIVRDAHIKVFPSSPVPVPRPVPNHTPAKVQRGSHPATILHRDVRRLVVILPIEEQTN